LRRTAADAPVISSAPQAGDVKEDVTPSASGQVIAAVDGSVTTTFTGSKVGTYGSFEVDAAGKWTYTLDTANHQDLAEGETKVETFTVTVSDSKGGTATQDVTVHVTGTNDVPVLSSTPASGSVTEDTVLTASGQLSVVDPDHGATITFGGGGTGAYGKLAVAANGTWTYTLDNAAHQDLGAADTKVESFTVTAMDDKGVTVSKDVVVSVHGTNDAAVLSSDSVALTEGNVASDLSASGKLTVSDVDSPATFVPQSASAGAYGSFSVDADGNWTYAATTAHNELEAGKTYDEVFTVKAADGTSTTVTVTITGTNDAAVLSSAIADLTEGDAASDISTSGKLTISDVDSAQTFVPQTSTSGAYGSFSLDTDGSWTYAASSAHDEFVAGQTYTDSFTATSADGTQASVTINILGTAEADVNVAPVASPDTND
jgi:VCBS repeat-containing protein